MGFGSNYAWYWITYIFQIQILLIYILAGTNECLWYYQEEQDKPKEGKVKESDTPHKVFHRQKNKTKKIYDCKYGIPAMALLFVMVYWAYGLHYANTETLILG